MPILKHNKPTQLVLFLLFLNGINEAASKPLSTSLQGQHLVIGLVPYPVILDFTRNASGYIIDSEGTVSQSLFWLAQRFNFTFSYLQVIGHTVDPRNGFKGIANYLASGECDVIAGTLSPDASRLSKMDFVAGFLYSPGVFLMQRPDATVNPASVIKPFQPVVWILLIVSIFAVIAALFVLNRYPVKSRTTLDTSGENKTRNSGVHSTSEVIALLTYVFGIFFSQGGHYYGNKINSFQVLAASLCLSAFVLVTAYNSLLISYIMKPNVQPLINSVEDLVNNPNVFLVVNKGTGIDKIISEARSGLYKELNNNLNSNSKSRCLRTIDCVETIKSGPYVYFNVYYVSLQIILKEYQVTKRCDLMIAKKQEYTPPSSWGFPKNSRYKDPVSIGLAEMSEFGLLKVWTQWYQANPQRCLDEVKKSWNVQNRTRLTLGNLTGAFVVLIVGCLASLLVFILENIMFLMCKKPYKSAVNCA